jgi:hypothetical protein
MQDVIRAGDAPIKPQEMQSLSFNAANLMSEFKAFSRMQPAHDAAKPLIEGLSSDADLLAQLNAVNLDVSQNPVQLAQADNGAGDATKPVALDAQSQVRDDFNTGPSDASGYGKANEARQTLDKLDANESILRTTFGQALPEQPDERNALNQIVSADESMAAVQKQVATGAMSPEDVVTNLEKAADNQITSRENLGDIAAQNGDGSQAVSAYLSALRMQHDNSWTASPDKGSDLYKKLESFGVSADDANSMIGLDAIKQQFN